MAEVSDQGLFPAEHRALRELHGTARHLARHWQRLADRLGDPAAAPLGDGAGLARALLRELDGRGAAHGLHGRPAAQGVGVNLAMLRRAGDRLLERNQALRLAVLDVQHVVTLLAWLEALAERRGDEEWAAFHRRWHAQLADAESSLRAAVLALAGDPDGAIAPLDPSPAGRAGHRIATAVGTAGEAIDASPLGRAVRRRVSRGGSGAAGPRGSSGG